MFIAALFIIARTWKQSRCPSADEWIRKWWYIYTMEYYSAIKKNTFESILMRWMKLEPIIQWSKSERKTPIHYTNAYIWNLDGNDNPICETAKETQVYRTVFWEKVRVGWSERIALKHVCYHMWNRSPVQVWCMRQGAQGRCTGMTQRDGMGREVEGSSGWGTQVNPWLIHVNIWQKPLQYCKVISLQLK